MVLGPLTHFEAKRALQRIRRISCSDLPFYSCVTSIFEVLDRVVPAGTFNTLFSFLEEKPTIVIPGLDLVRWAPVWARIRMSGDRTASGTLVYDDLVRTKKKVLSHEEFALSNFHQSPGYEELYSPLNAEHFLVIPLKSSGKFYGYMNIVRPRNSLGFRRWELEFMNRAAPFLSHAMAIRGSANFRQTAPASGMDVRGGRYRKGGLIIIDDRGKLQSIDQNARCLLGQVALLSYSCDLSCVCNPYELLDLALRRIVRAIHRADSPDADLFEEGDLPETSLYLDPSGLTLTLRGYRMDGMSGKGNLIGVILDETIPATMQLRLLQVTYGLSPQELEIVRLLEARRSRHEIAEALSIKESTLRTVLGRIFEKLEVEGVCELREILSGSRPSREFIYSR